MRNPIPKIKFPDRLLAPIGNFLRRQERDLIKRRKSLLSQDPFVDTARLKDSAAADADAQEQVGHAQIEALRREVDRKLIQVRQALSRIKIGRYGTCENCGKMIDTERLMVKPEATWCVECEREKEKS